MTLRLLIVTAILVMLLNAHGWAAAEAVSSSAPAGTASQIPEVTVTARRELEKRVAKFVNQIAAAENGDEGLARWRVPPVCPLVSGLPRQDGEFILERLSQIAYASGVPLADEHCRPNLYILVTDQPEDLLRGMEKRNRPYTFGYNLSLRAETSASIVDEFIKTPRAVRVWYNSAEKDAWGLPVSYCPTTDIELITCMRGDPKNDCDHPPPFDPTRATLCGRGATGGTHLLLNNMWWFSRVFVVVDQKRLHDVKLEQLADYVAMAGFAKLKPDAHLEGTPTILTLFNGAPENAPTAMTDWDQSFLKSLYSTEQISKQQRSHIARSMVREIVP